MLTFTGCQLLAIGTNTRTNIGTNIATNIGTNITKTNLTVPLRTLLTLQSLNICATSRTHRGTTAGINYFRIISSVRTTGRRLRTNIEHIHKWRINPANLIDICRQTDTRYNVTCVLLNARSICKTAVTVGRRDYYVKL